MKYNNLILNTENDPRIHQQFSMVMELVPFIPALYNLVAEATKNGTVTVDFVTKNETHTNGSFETQWYQQWVIRGNIKTITKQTVDRKIKVVKENQTFAQMLETLVFELGNAKNPYFQPFDPNEIKPEAYSDRNDFAQAKEQKEYTYTHIPTKRILQEIFGNPETVALFKAKGLPLSQYDLNNLIYDGFATFNDWWKKVNQNIDGRSYSHSEVYRRAYDQWAAKHPRAKAPVVPAKPVNISQIPATPAASKAQISVVPPSDPLPPPLPWRPPVQTTTTQTKPTQASSLPPKAPVQPATTTQTKPNQAPALPPRPPVQPAVTQTQPTQAAAQIFFTVRWDGQKRHHHHGQDHGHNHHGQCHGHNHHHNHSQGYAHNHQHGCHHHNQGEQQTVRRCMAFKT